MNYSMIKSKFIKIIAAMLFVFMIAGNIALPVFAAAGAYTVTLSVSYANPETGRIVDGGSNEALGNSMCESIMEAEALVEEADGVYYVTLGFGLASNIGSTEVLIQAAEGTDEYEAVSLTETGTCERDGDTCIHYRFEMSDPQVLISPKLYVTAMGREVQFFIRLNLDEKSEGTGNFRSEMAIDETEPESEPQTETEEETEKVSETMETESETETKEPETETEETADTEEAGLHVYGNDDENMEKKGSFIPIIAGAAVLIAGVGIFLLFKRKT